LLLVALLPPLARNTQQQQPNPKHNVTAAAHNNLFYLFKKRIPLPIAIYISIHGLYFYRIAAQQHRFP